MRQVKISSGATLQTREICARGSCIILIASAAAERFSHAIEEVMELVPQPDHTRVEQRLRSTSELAFLLHGLEFARARISLAPGSFAHTLEITFGTGEAEMPLTPAARDEILARVTELFERRRATPRVERKISVPPHRRIGPASSGPAHSRLPLRGRAGTSDVNPAQDPLYRAAPERWLESVLRHDLAPLTRNLAHTRAQERAQATGMFANDPDPDTRGNRIDPEPLPHARHPHPFLACASASRSQTRLHAGAGHCRCERSRHARPARE